MSKEEAKITEEETEERDLKDILPDKRVKAINFIKDIYCVACEYEADCSSRYPEYLVKCRYLEEWALKIYREMVENRIVSE